MENVVFGPYGSMIRSLVQGRGEAYAVVDSNVAGRFAPVLDDAGVKWMAFRASEERKSLEVLQEIAGWLLEMEAGRGALLLGIGGGVTTDITAFAASVYKRGISYALVPTTLLAQVDAAVGGKTGINFRGYKNMIGTFGLPDAVLVDTAVLDTLPEKEVRSGMAEVLKTLIVGDAELFTETVEQLREQPWLSEGIVSKAVHRCIGIKSEIVEADRRESGERMKLNLGHTLGHAVESLCLEAGSPVTHGEAVAAGIIAAAEVSFRNGLLDCGIASVIADSFKSLGYSGVCELLKMRTGLAEPDIPAKLFDFVRNDKKRKEDFINFVMIRGLGSVVVKALAVSELHKFIYDLH